MATKTLESKTITNKKTEIGLLEINKPLHVIMLPSKATSVIVNYSSSSAIKVSCTLPSKYQEINHDHDFTAKIKTPPILMTAMYAQIPTSKSDIIGFHIFGFNKEDNSRLLAVPYVMPNVWTDGKICYGELEPTDLRSAYNLFWSTTFTDDLHAAMESAFDSINVNNVDLLNSDAEELVNNYNKLVFNKQDWRDYTKELCGDKYWASSQPTDAVLVTADKSLLKQIPRKFWKKQGGRIGEGRPILIANAKRHKNVWSFISGDLKFKLPINQVITKFKEKINDENRR